MTTTASEAGSTRMRSEDRRVLILDAATAVFGERGYHGATTDAVAREAGVSQPYVVRMFGSKEALFLAVIERAFQRMMSAFERALAENAASEDAGDTDAIASCIGRHYIELLSDRGLLLSLMQAFMLGGDPVIGGYARGAMRRVYEFLRSAGMDASAAHAFLSGGMMLNTLVALRMADDYETEPAVRELLEEVFPTKLALLLALRDTDS